MAERNGEDIIEEYSTLVKRNVELINGQLPVPAPLEKGWGEANKLPTTSIPDLFGRLE